MSFVFKPGVLPNDPNKARLYFRMFARPGAVAPASVDYSHVPVIGNLGNDKFGCCVYSGDGHTVEQQTYYGQGTEYVVSEAEVLNAYSAQTGFNPNDPSTDNGDTIQHGLEFLQKVGFGGHKIAAFAQLDTTNLEEVKLAVAEFGAVAVGLSFPKSAADQFSAGQVWTPVSGSPIEGGHRVTLVGYDAQYLVFLTWGSVCRMDYAFWNSYVVSPNGEAWATVGIDWWNAATGLDPEGVDKYQLGAQYAALTGQPNPFPAPTPPPVPPTPPTPPTPVADPAEKSLALAAHKYLASRFLKPGYLVTSLKAWLADKHL